MEKENEKPPLFIKGERRIGNTTRLVDYYIQELFATGLIKIDHESLTDKTAFHEILSRITKRMINEHPRVSISSRVVKRKKKLSLVIAITPPIDENNDKLYIELCERWNKRLEEERQQSLIENLEQVRNKLNASSIRRMKRFANANPIASDSEFNFPR